ncbi:3-demethylubiquinone-9 3-O-methyltransferase [Microcoleus sp. FACHB-1515]|nr:3-demethylubiquinone-9 3-O-methyltransferase [Microcoleus sp. FACHB-1515]
MQRNDLSFYDRMAPHWWNRSAKIFALNHLNPLRFEYFDRFVPDWQGLRVLDVGCGGGYTCEFLASRGAIVSGIDQSQACINSAIEHAKQDYSIEYQQGFAEKLPYLDDSFDVVICVDVLEHVDNVEKSIAQIQRVLKPGGIFLFDTINRTWKSKVVMIWLLENLLGEIPRGVHDWHQFILPQELRNYLERSQFSEITLHGFNLLGETIPEQIEAYRYYRKTKNFRASISDDLSVMYIGKAILK